MTAGLRPVFALVVSLIALPGVLAFGEAVAFQVRNGTNRVLVSSGQKRAYLLHVPRGLDRARPVPLVISMHGAGGWPGQQRDISRWDRLADERGFLVVYPSALGGGGPRVWRADPASRDVRFLADLIDELQVSHGVDPARIYANGLSNGAGMAFALSCALSDRIAAVGLVAAAQTMPWSRCRDERPVPMIAFHGTDDPLTPYAGGLTWIAPAPFPGIASFTARWARRNRCGATPLESAAAADVTRIEYPGCAESAPVVLYRVEGGGHTWPGGEPLVEWFTGRTSNGVDATRLMWEFFRAHPLRVRVTDTRPPWEAHAGGA